MVSVCKLPPSRDNQLFFGTLPLRASDDVDLTFEKSVQDLAFFGRKRWGTDRLTGLAHLGDQALGHGNKVGLASLPIGGGIEYHRFAVTQLLVEKSVQQILQAVQGLPMSADQKRGIGRFEFQQTGVKEIFTFNPCLETGEIEQPLANDAGGRISVSQAEANPRLLGSKTTKKARCWSLQNIGFHLGSGAIKMSQTQLNSLSEGLGLDLYPEQIGNHHSFRPAYGESSIAGKLSTDY